MEDRITKDDLRQFRLQLLHEIGEILDAKTSALGNAGHEPIEWLRSKAIRRIMDISPGTLQNLRIAGKIRYKKVMGSYYYNKADVLNLFEDKE